MNNIIISPKMFFRDVLCIITEYEEAHLHCMGETYYPNSTKIKHGFKNHLPVLFFYFYSIDISNM